jgi:hypothetical protein
MQSPGLFLENELNRVIETCSIKMMQGVNQIIVRLILADAARLEGKAPVFTKAFVDYVTRALAKSPELDATANGWRDLINGFHHSLSSLELRELAIISALVSFELAIQETPAAASE